MEPLILTRQEFQTWLLPDNPAAGNTGATGTPPVPSTRLVYDTARVFRIDLNPNKADYGGIYCYRKLTPVPNATDFVYQREFWIEKSDEGKPQALEFEIQQNIDGIVFNWAVQFRYGDKTIRTYNFAKRQQPGVEAWEPTGKMFTPFSGGTWHQVRLLAGRTPDLMGSHRELYIDGTATGVAISRPGYNGVALPGDILNFAEQLDINPDRGGYEIAFRNMQFEARG